MDSAKDLGTAPEEKSTRQIGTLAPAALNSDQARMYTQFDRAIEAKDMQAAQVVGHRIVVEAKANGARPGVISFVEDILRENS